MHSHHLFIFQPGIWLGDGHIKFSYSPEKLKFYTRWQIISTVEADKQPVIVCNQTVEVVGFEEKTENQLTFIEEENNEFLVYWKSESFEIQGKGRSDASSISWEFTEDPEYTGREMYALQNDGSYLFLAEYGSPAFQTIANGRIWANG